MDLNNVFLKAFVDLLQFFVIGLKAFTPYLWPFVAAFSIILVAHFTVYQLYMLNWRQRKKWNSLIWSFGWIVAVVNGYMHIT